MIEEDDSIGLDANTARLLLKSVRGYAIYLLDPGGHVTTWNPGAEAIKGYSAKEVFGKHFSIFYTPEDRTVGEPERELTAASSGVYKSEGWRLRKDGQRFWASVTLTPLIDESNDLRGFAKVTQDMTEHRRAQEERIRLERAEEALLLRDKFLDEAKSSLNVILTSIRIHVNSLKATVEIVGGESSPAIKAKLTTLEWGLDRLSKMTDDVLSLAADTGNKLVQQLHSARVVTDAPTEAEDRCRDPFSLSHRMGACGFRQCDPVAGARESGDRVLAGIPVDLYIPGCPPHPFTILDGLLRLLDRMEPSC